MSTPHRHVSEFAGSQQREPIGYAQPYQANIITGQSLIRPRTARPGDVSLVPSKQRVAGSIPARRAEHVPGRLREAAGLGRPSLSGFCGDDLPIGSYLDADVRLVGLPELVLADALAFHGHEPCLVVNDLACCGAAFDCEDG